MPKQKIDIAEVFETWKDSTDRIKELNAELKELDKQRKVAEKLLSSAIPADDVKDGVQHLTVRKVNVAYSEALEEVRATLVAKTKYKEVDKIIASFTSETFSHKFKAV